jgi:hypothetical protein
MTDISAAALEKAIAKVHQLVPEARRIDTMVGCSPLIMPSESTNSYNPRSAMCQRRRMFNAWWRPWIAGVVSM